MLVVRNSSEMLLQVDPWELLNDSEKFYCRQYADLLRRGLLYPDIKQSLIDKVSEIHDKHPTFDMSHVP